MRKFRLVVLGENNWEGHEGNFGGDWTVQYAFAKTHWTLYWNWGRFIVCKIYFIKMHGKTMASNIAPTILISYNFLLVRQKKKVNSFFRNWVPEPHNSISQCTSHLSATWGQELSEGLQTLTPTKYNLGGWGNTCYISINLNIIQRYFICLNIFISRRYLKTHFWLCCARFAKRWTKSCCLKLTAHVPGGGGRG